MTTFAVVREAGPAWGPGGIADQQGVGDHAAFMGSLADAGFVLFGGPLGGSELGRLRALLIVEAAGETDIRRRLAADPWERSAHLVTASIESWMILVARSPAPDPS